MQQPQYDSFIQLVSECLSRAPNVHVAVTTSLLELVFAHEHLAVPVADLIKFLQEKHDNTKIAADMISYDVKHSYIIQYCAS